MGGYIIFFLLHIISDFLARSLKRVVVGCNAVFFSGVSQLPFKIIRVCH